MLLSIAKKRHTEVKSIIPALHVVPAVFIFIVLLFPNRIVAGTTGALEGKITDKEHHEGVPGVQIFLVGTSFAGITDSAGRYHIGNIRAGVYDIRCEHIGYRTVTVKEISVQPDIRNQLNIAIEQSSIELSPVEITVERSMVEIDQPATAFSIGQPKIAQLPVSTISDIIALQPSTTIEGNIRGGKTSDVLYLIDGLPMQDVIAGGTSGSVPKEAISGMTIVTGGFDAEYGNALSGIVNVVTKTASDHHTVIARVEKDNLFPNSISDQYNRYNNFELTASGPLSSNRLSYFSANTYKAEDTRWWSDFDHFFQSPISTEWNGLEKLEYTFSPETHLSLQCVFDVSGTRDYEYSWRYNLNGLPPEHRSSNRFAALFSSMFSPKAYFSVSIDRYNFDSKIGDGQIDIANLQPYEYDLFLRYIISGSRNWSADTRQTIWTLKGDLTDEAIDPHYVKIGMEINRYSIFSDVVKYDPQLTYYGKPIPDAPLLNYSTSYDYNPWSGSIYAQDKLQLDQQGSQFSFGIRWDFFDPRAERPVVEFIPTNPNEYSEQVSGTTSARFKQQISPRLAVSTSLDPKTFVFLNFGRYMQLPLFDYLYSGLTPAQLYRGSKNVLTGNPDLEPERTVQWELGVKRELGPDMLLSATYFIKNIENQVDAKTLIPADSKFAGDFGFASYINNATADANGIEIVLAREHDEHITGSISYTYMSTEGWSDYADQRLNFAQWGFAVAPATFPLSWDQTHTLKLDLLLQLPFGIQTNAVVLYNSARPYTYYPTRDGFTPADSTIPFVPNNARMSDVVLANLKVQKRFTLNTLGARALTVYFDGRNILNTKNVKWMDSNGRIGGELSDPGGYYDPRRARIGLTMEW